MHWTRKKRGKYKRIRKHKPISDLFHKSTGKTAQNLQEH